MDYGFKFMECKLFSLEEYDEEVSWIMSQTKMRKDGYWASCKNYTKETEEHKKGTTFGEMYIDLDRTEDFPDYVEEVRSRYIQKIREDRLSKLLS
ncbi:MAG: hypothetical protein SLAVMIC_00694 [uncultured marine phage]|uniref:Uncharacterized protein n=1 Tax=uncultured marine phage TaxID=707152 RepID=A0A8D9CAF9_9VIRU|nr:MAG: hypothetical protein SLAVMIC_00694 [uncultured marine phage]